MIFIYPASIKKTGAVRGLEMTHIGDRLAKIYTQIKTAAHGAGRNAEDITLVAVSKTHDLAAVREALQVGQRVFGENRVQEATGKFAALKTDDPEIELHLIGPLQTNKVDDAVRLFDVIETLDRPKLAEAIAKSSAKTGRHPRCYIEVNIGAEPQKAGIAPQQLGEFLTFCRSLDLTIDGLMCIPPQDGYPAFYFRQMKILADQHGLARLSMGMSGDFETAIACGATTVRIGTAIFGVRDKDR